MSASAAVTRKDIDDVLNVLDVIMTRIDDRFSDAEAGLAIVQKRVLEYIEHVKFAH